MMFLERFKRYIRENNLLGAEERVLLAVSGGVDSMSMLALFARARELSEGGGDKGDKGDKGDQGDKGGGWPVGVAHCNFGLRGEEGDEDTELVKRECERYGLPCYVRDFDTTAEMERTGESVQMAARRLRYAWFDELCREHGYTAVAIAHQADDSVETFFINLFRGTGLRGLTGINPVNGRVVRPLLFATRHEITDWAMAAGVPYREDSSNSSTKYLRNKIRLGLVPRLREINPRFTYMMQRNVDRLTQTQGFIDAAMRRIRGEVQTTDGERFTIDTTLIDKEFPVGFVVYELLSSGFGFKGDVIDQIVRSLERGTSGRRFYSRGWVAFTDRGHIIVEPITEDDLCEVVVERTARRVYAGNAVYYLQHIDIDTVETLSVGENVALVDDDKLQWPLVFRRWREGDRFVPLGMQGSKKLSDYLTDTKVSLAAKGRQFVLVNGSEAGSEASGGSEAAGEVVWVAGRRLDDRFKVVPSTENVLRITRELI